MAEAIRGGDAMRAKLQSMLTSIQGAKSVRVGFLEGNTEPDGTPVAQAAAWAEFGTKSAPPRPFFRNALEKAKPELPGITAKIAKAANYDANVILGRLGEYMQGEIQQTIIELTEPALSPLTLAIRKYQGPTRSKPITGTIIGQLAKELKAGTLDTSGVSDKPLVYTGTMLRYVAYEVNA